MRSIITVLLVASMLPSFTLAQNCIDYGEYLHTAGGVKFPIADPWFSGIAFVDNYAYVASGCLYMLDITNPAGPKPVGCAVGTSSAMDVAISGSYAYVAAHSGFLVLDITNRTSPQVVGSVGTSTSVFGIAVSGSYVYAAEAHSGLELIDIAEPTSPQIVGSVDTPGLAYGVAVSGSYAYVADCGAGLQVIDITEPDSPQIIGSVDTPGDAWDVVVSGSYAFVADRFSGYQVIDIADPMNPRIAYGVFSAADTRGLTVSEGHVYVASADGYDYSCMLIDDIPYVGPDSYKITLPPYVGWVINVGVYGNYAYSVFVNPSESSYTYLQVVDIENIENSPILGKWVRVDTRQFSGKISTSGNYAYIAGGYSGLYVLDISDMHNPYLLANVDTPGFARDVAVNDSYAYVADNEFGFQVVDITNPANPQIVGNIDTQGPTGAIAISGGYAYIADVYKGVQIVDISEPTNPHIIATVYMPDSPLDVAVSGNFVYVGCGGVFDSEPSLEIVDVSDLANIRIAGSVRTNDSAHEVVVSGEYAYVIDTNLHPLNKEPTEKFSLINVSEPTNPYITGSINVLSTVSDLAVHGNVAYIAGHCGLQVIDITDPEDPKIIGGKSSSGQGMGYGGVAVNEEYVYATNAGGLMILPMQCNSTLPHEKESGWRHLDNTERHLELTINVRPNPFNPQTTITFTLDRAQHAEVAIYDLTGRLLRVLDDRSYDPGNHSVVWNGRDSQGRAMPSGTYIVRLETEIAVEARKVMLLR